MIAHTRWIELLFVLVILGTVGVLSAVSTSTFANAPSVFSESNRCTPEGKRSPPQDVADDGVPLCFVYRHPAGPGRQEPVGGLVFAVWGDGTVLYALNPSKPGVNLHVARLRDEVAVFLDQLRSDGAADLDRTAYTVPCADETKVVIRFGEEIVRLIWDERILRGYGANTKPDESYRSFVKAWYMTKITISSVSIRDYRKLVEQDLIDGAYRGYVVDAPGKTSWLYVGIE